MKKSMVFLALIFSIGIFSLLSLPSNIPTNNKAMARRVFDEIFNQGKFAVAGQIYAKDFVNHGLTRDYSF